MHERAMRILQLSRNQGDYASYAQMMEMYQDMRSKIKSDLELGNPDVAVDYELFTEGLILDNYQALQSVLGFNNYQDTSKEFSDALDYTYTQKLAYALKQNKLAFQTQFEIKKTSDQTLCKILINGKELKQSSFPGPAGIPFYIGIYCPEHLYAVKKVQAAESQKSYIISFDNLKKSIYRDDPVEMGIPNPYPAFKKPDSSKPSHVDSSDKQKTSNQPNSPKKQQNKILKDKPGLIGLNNFYIGTGIGLDWYLVQSSNNFYYSHSRTPMLLYSSTQMIFKNFEFILDLGSAEKTTQNNLNHPTVIRESSLFVRPTLSYINSFYRYKEIFVLNGDAGLTIFFANTEQSILKPMSYGVRVGIGPTVYLAPFVYLGADVGTIYNFAGPARNLLLSTGFKLGIDL